MLERLKQYRTDLHQIPELGFEEYKTKAYIKTIARKLNCTIHEVADTGLVLYFDNGKSKTIAFRADMDALPITEDTDLPFTSKYVGKMHACGHDGHMAILLGLAHYIHEHGSILDKNVVLVFQPSEERDAGATVIVESGLLEQYDVKAIFGLHLWPGLPQGKSYSRAGEFMAMGSEITITIHGKSAHVADSAKAIDSLYIGCKFLCDLYYMESTLETDGYRLLKFGELHAGTVRNVIADNAVLSGTLRSFDPELHQNLKKQIQMIANRYEEQYHCEIEIHYHDGYDAVINNSELYDNIIAKIPTINQLPNPVMQAEDFGLYRKICPSLFFFLGAGDTAPLHNEKFDFDMNILQDGLNLFIDVLVKY